MTRFIPLAFACTLAGAGRAEARDPAEHRKPTEFAPSFWRELRVEPTGHAAKQGIEGRTVTLHFSPLLVRQGTAPTLKQQVRRSTILFVNDNQVMWDGPGSPHGGVQLNRTIDEMTRRGEIGPVIVVGIPNAGGERINEYAGRITGQPAKQEAFEQYVMRDVLPAVSRALGMPRLDPKRTWFGGVSYGADSATSIVLRHPEHFAGAVNLSGYRRFGSASGVHELSRYLEGQSPPRRRPKILLGSGEADDHERYHLGEFHELVRVLQKSGYTVAEHPGHLQPAPANADLHVFIDPPAQHNEASWRAQMAQWALPLIAPRARLARK